MKYRAGDYVYRQAEGELRDKSIAFHWEKYGELGFFNGKDQDFHHKESTYFAAVLAADSQLAGVGRLIRKPVCELPVYTEFLLSEEGRTYIASLPSGSCAELSALAKLPQHDCTIGIIKACLHFSLFHGIEHWLCAIDERVYHLMCRIFHSPFEILGEPAVYLGTRTIPAVIPLHSGLAMLRQHKEQLYSYLLQPDHLEAVTHD
ncbi:hypothetical protein V1498_18425 [Peribacillus sp. SCS-26]|uniref:hypothetical protein n=1 Tax=Paraperibacillus marinus TaxID=3115295 RepID=UPI003905EB08